MTLSAFLSPFGLLALLTWNFAALAAIQLTLRLIMAFSVRTTLLGAVHLTLWSLPVAALYDLAVGTDASFATRLAWAPLAMCFMAVGGFLTARWPLRFKRTRGRLAAAAMAAFLSPHLFTLALPLL